MWLVSDLLKEDFDKIRCFSTLCHILHIKVVGIIYQNDDAVLGV